MPFHSCRAYAGFGPGPPSPGGGTCLAPHRLRKPVDYRPTSTTPPSWEKEVCEYDFFLKL